MNEKDKWPYMDAGRIVDVGFNYVRIGHPSKRGKRFLMKQAKAQQNAKTNKYC